MAKGHNKKNKKGNKGKRQKKRNPQRAQAVAQTEAVEQSEAKNHYQAPAQPEAQTSTTPTDSNPNFKEIIVHSRHYSTLGTILESPIGPRQTTPFLGYLEETQTPKSENEREDRTSAIRANTATLANFVTPYFIEHQDKIITEIDKNVRRVLLELKQRTLVQLAEPILGDENYKTGKAVLKDGNSSDLRSYTSGIYTSSRIWQELMAGSSTGTVKDELQKISTKDRHSYMIKDLGLDVETGEINKVETAAYIAPHIKTEEQMLKIGLTYAQQ